MPGFVSAERLSYGPWQAIERMVARFLLHCGFRDVAIVGGAGDHGADVVGTRGDERWVVQAKFRSNGVVGVQACQEALFALNSYDADTAVAVSNGGFTEEARQFQRDLKSKNVDLRLWSGSKLLDFFGDLPSSSTQRRALRGYQETAVEEVEAKRSLGARSALVTMATGLGKTIVASQLIANELDRNPEQEVLVLAHMSDLVRQLEVATWSQLEKHVSTHLWTDGEKPAYYGGVVFATWQSLREALRRGASLLGRFGLVIVDEAHHAPSNEFRIVLDSLGANFLVGMTATPWRSDDSELQPLFGETVFSMDIVEGMQAGFLADVEYRMLTDGIDWEEISRLSKQGLTVKELNRKLLLPERDRGMVELVCKRLRAGKRKRALAFCRSIEHSELLRPIFQEYGVRTAVLHSKLSREERFRNLSAFRSGRVEALISIEMLNEGIDVPDVDLIAFMRVTHSRRIFLQQLGRGLRVSSQKENVLILDFVADVRRIAAGVRLNRDAERSAAKREVLRFQGGEIVRFDNDSPAGFFRQYLADVASIENMEDGARLRFPSGEVF